MRCPCMKTGTVLLALLSGLVVFSAAVACAAQPQEKKGAQQNGVDNSGEAGRLS